MKAHVLKMLFERNAAEIGRLRQAGKDAFRARSERPQGQEVWNQAAKGLHEQYGELAFPGGLGRAYELLAEGDPQTAETAIVFLEVHPYFHGSQYIATKLMQKLKKLRLCTDMQERFDAVRAATRERRRRLGIKPRC